MSGPPWPQPDISGWWARCAGRRAQHHHPYLLRLPVRRGRPSTGYARLPRSTTTRPPASRQRRLRPTRSWFVFAALGFYPVNAATGVYIIGSPLVNRVAIRNPGTAKPSPSSRKIIRPTTSTSRAPHSTARSSPAPAYACANCRRRRPPLPHGQQAQQGMGISPRRPATLRAPQSLIGNRFGPVTSLS